MELFANIVDYIQTLTIFTKDFILVFSQGKCASDKTKQNLGALSLISHKILTNHHLPVPTHHSKFRLTLSNFFGECKEIQSKLHSIITILLQWVWAMSVGSKSLCGQL